MTYPDLTDLDRVHADVNQYPYVRDVAWVDATMAKGANCTGYAVAKKHHLMALGWPIQILRIGIVLVEPSQRIDGETHAVLYIDDDHVLDNRQMTVASVDGLQRCGYEPVELQESGESVYFQKWSWV